MLSLNIIEPSTSSYCSPLWLTKKKDGSFKICFDGRKLNSITSKEANLTVNLDKCNFCRPNLKFLGYVVDSQGLRTDPDKVTAIKDFPIPKTTTQLRRILGMCGYYRRFVRSYSTLLSPLTDLLKNRKKGQTITWNPEADDAFHRIKEALTSAPVMTSPDFSEHFYLMTDYSNTASGGVLFQMKDGSEHPIAYTSKKLNKAQKITPLPSGNSLL
ncbi:uncharacterized protein [Diabrotica undecimpunctata]|uniref:uncharacterized protein n=1 Tax=Diabrotica undecimpunctata TaxID=50387 RepID=UPI003B63FBA8